MHNSKIKYKHFSYARNLYGTVAQTKVRTEAEPQHMHTHPNKFIKQIVRTFFGELLGNWIGIQFRDGLCFVSILSENTSEIFGWIEMQLQSSSGKWEVKNACEVLDANACSGKFLQYELVPDEETISWREFSKLFILNSLLLILFISWLTVEGRQENSVMTAVSEGIPVYIVQMNGWWNCG